MPQLHNFEWRQCLPNIPSGEYATVANDSSVDKVQIIHCEYNFATKTTIMQKVPGQGHKLKN